MTSFYEITCVEFNVDSDGNLLITAIIENRFNKMDRELPDYAPAICQTKVYPEYLPHGLKFKGKSQQELEEIVNRFGLLYNQEWNYVIKNSQYQKNGGYQPTGAQLYF